MKNIIDYLTIKSTINELAKTENVTLVDKLLDILNNNKIAKSEKHNKKEDIKTNHYKIDLSKNQLNDIIDLLMDLEVVFGIWLTKFSFSSCSFDWLKPRPAH